MKYSEMLCHPGMIGGNVVGHEIQQQLHAPLGQFLPRCGQCPRAAQVAIHNILTNAVRRSHIVGALIVRQRPSEVHDKALIPICDCDSGGTALPDTHQPYRIKAVRCDGVPICGRYRTQVSSLSRLAGQLGQPDPGIDLVHCGIRRPGRHLFSLTLRLRGLRCLLDQLLIGIECIVQAGKIRFCTDDMSNLDGDQSRPASRAQHGQTHGHADLHQFLISSRTTARGRVIEVRDSLGVHHAARASVAAIR